MVLVYPLCARWRAKRGGPNYAPYQLSHVRRERKAFAVSTAEKTKRNDVSRTRNKVAQRDLDRRLDSQEGRKTSKFVQKNASL